MSNENNNTRVRRVTAAAAVAVVVGSIAVLTMLSVVTSEDIFLPVISLTGKTDYGYSVVTSGTQSLEEFTIEHAVLRVFAYWSEIEATEGVYSWPQSLDNQVALADGPLYINVTNTPAWARPTGSKVCSPPYEENREDFAEFVEAVIIRYEPDYIEIWNEPDVPESVGDWYMGCFGLDYEDGEEYAEVVSAVMDEIDYINIKVVVGALAHPFVAEGYDFWEGALDSEVYNDADYASFHKYIPWPWGEYQEYYFGLVSDALDFMQETPLPIILSETSVRCQETSWCGTDFEDDKAEYVDFVGTLDLHIAMFYSLGGNNWDYTDLVYGGEAMPAWYALESLVMFEDEDAYPPPEDVLPPVQSDAYPAPR